MAPRPDASDEQQRPRDGAAKKTLLLDMDGVLAEVSQSYRAAIIATCREHGAKSVTLDTVAEWKARGGCNNDWALSLDLINSDPDGERGLTLEEVTKTFERFYQGDSEGGVRGLYELESLIPKMSTLEELKRRCAPPAGGGMAVVTGRPRGDCDQFLRLFKMEHLFDVCVCMEDGPPKPDPFPILRACEKLGVEPSRDVIMVGDTPDDIVAAVKAGCRAVGVVTPENFEKSKKEGLPVDSCKMSGAMKQSGADVIMEPGFAPLVDMIPDVSPNGSA